MPNRGFTLVELITSIAIMIVAITTTCMMLIEGQRFTRNAEEIANSNDNARSAGEFIVHALRIAGIGSSAGAWINNGGTPRLISPIFGTDNITAEGSTDDIWMLLPDRRSFQDNTCQDGSGAALAVTAAGTGILNVNCSRSLIPSVGTPPGMLLVTNFTGPGVLLTQPLATVPSDGTVLGLVGFSELGLPGYPPRQLQVGELVISMTAVRFFVHRDASGSSLYRESGVLSGASPPSFVPSTVSRMRLQKNIEDLQIAYGTDPTNSNLPDQYVYSNGFSDTPGLPLRLVRITVVATHDRALREANNALMIGSQPMSIENHAVSAPADGIRRAVYTRRVELPNLNAGSL